MKRGKKHPIRGFFAGLLLGLAVAQLLIVFSVIALGTSTPWIVVLACIVFGVLWSLFGPARLRGSRPASEVQEPSAVTSTPQSDMSSAAAAPGTSATADAPPAESAPATPADDASAGSDSAPAD
jgi:hypothetical protein